MLTIDFSNAFNTADRKLLLQKVFEKSPLVSNWANWSYSQHSFLFVRSTHEMSCKGVKQGDPLGPYYLCLVLDELVKAINERFNDLNLHVWYLDDGTIICPSESVKDVLEFIADFTPTLGLVMNRQKCYVYAPTFQPEWHDLPPEIQKSTEGIVVLGTPVGKHEYIAAFAEEKADQLIAAIDLLPEINNKQSELLLVRACFGNAKFTHLTNTIDPGILAEALSKIDYKVQRIPEGCIGYTFKNKSHGLGGISSDNIRDLWSLPRSFGGFALPELLPLANINFISSILSTKDLQIIISGKSRPHPDLPNLNIDHEKLSDIASTAQGHQIQKKLTLIYNQKLHAKIFANADYRSKALLTSRQISGSQNWLYVFPSEYKGTKFDSTDFCALLRYNSGLPFEHCPTFCCECNNRQDPYGDHALSCKSTGASISKHDDLCDTIATGCENGAFQIDKEMSLDGTTTKHDQKNQRREIKNRGGDIVIKKYEGGKDLYVDVTVVNPLCQTYIDDAQKPLGACKKRIEEKKTKYKNVIGGKWFEPMVVESLGGWSSNSYPIFKRIAQRSAPRKNITYSAALKDLSTKLSVSLQKSNGAMLSRRVLAP